MENIGVGLMLMVVGMATVFVILLIVIYLSNANNFHLLYNDHKQLLLHLK